MAHSLHEHPPIVTVDVKLYIASLWFSLFKTKGIYQYTLFGYWCYIGLSIVTAEDIQNNRCRQLTKLIIQCPLKVVGTDKKKGSGYQSDQFETDPVTDLFFINRSTLKNIDCVQRTLIVLKIEQISFIFDFVFTDS